MFAEITPVLPKLSVVVLTIVHEAVMVIWTVKVDVVVAAKDALINSKRQNVTPAHFDVS